MVHFMKSKIAILISLLAVAVLFGTGRPLLFTLAIIFTVVYISADFARAYIVARPEMDQYKNTAKQMELDGATDEEIIEYMNTPIEYKGHEFDYSIVPSWIPVLVILSFVTSVILLISGIIIRIR